MEAPTLLRGEETEVSQKAYSILTKDYSGVIAHRQEQGKFYILLFITGYRTAIQKIIQNNPK